MSEEWQPHRRREAALAAIEQRLKNTTGDNTALQFDRARLLTELGRTGEAKAAYLALLQQTPSHFGGLNNFGALLYTTGFRTAARTVYAEAVRQHPDNPTGHVNLANALLADGELPAAREHYERALALSPDHAAAHQGFANLLMETGEEKTAQEHRRRAYQNRAVTTLPYRGTNKPVPVILLIAAAGGNVPIERFLDDQIFSTTVIAAEFFDPATPPIVPLPPHRLIVNAIGDADLAPTALAAALSITAKTKAPVINPPEAVLPTGRVAIAERFANTPGIVAPHMATIARTELSLPQLKVRGFTTPFLLRAPGFHTGRHFYQINTAQELAEALTAIPGDHLTLIEYLDARGSDGKIRKYRVMMIDGKIYPLHVAIAQTWKIHYFTADMAGHPEHRAEDAKFLENMPEVLGPRAIRALEHIRDTLKLDYAGVDFGLNENGDILLFEANATMVVNPPEPDPRWAYRRAAIERITDAVHNMLLQK